MQSKIDKNKWKREKKVFIYIDDSNKCECFINNARIFSTFILRSFFFFNFNEFDDYLNNVKES